MSVVKSQVTERRLPKGFVPGNGGLASEHARAMGWEIYEDERTRTAGEKLDANEGRDDDYAAAEFGAEAKSTGAETVAKTVAGRPALGRETVVVRPALGRAPTRNPIAVKPPRRAA
jgi:hypothetical protein